MQILLCASFAIAQEQPASPEPPTEPVAAEPSTEPAPAAPAAEPAQAAPAPEPAAAAPAPAAPAPVAQQAAQAAAPAAAAAAPAAAKEATPTEIAIGAKAGLGLSNFRGHKAFDFGQRAAKLGMSIAFSAGIASDIKINSLFSVAPELQYSYYGAGANFSMKTDADFNDVNEVYLYLHAIEIPVMARFSFGSYYAELGPQIGCNLSSKAYKNAAAKQPDLNIIAFGPSFGGGVRLSEKLIAGARFHLGMLEYAENTKGHPWTVQVGATQFLF